MHDCDKTESMCHLTVTLTMAVLHSMLLLTCGLQLPLAAAAKRVKNSLPTQGLDLQSNKPPHVT